MCTIGLHTAISYCSILYKTIKYKRDDHYLSSEIEINKVTYSHATFLFKWWNFIALILFKLYYTVEGVKTWCTCIVFHFRYRNSKNKRSIHGGDGVQCEYLRHSTPRTMSCESAQSQRTPIIHNTPSTEFYDLRLKQIFLLKEDRHVISLAGFIFM